jgi:hypothetical protein
MNTAFVEVFSTGDTYQLLAKIVYYCKFFPYSLVLLPPLLIPFLARRTEVLETSSIPSPVKQVRLCHSLTLAFAYRLVCLHASPTGAFIGTQQKVEHDKLGGVSRNPLHGSASPGTVSPQRALLLVPICRRDPICLTCGPALPIMSQMLFRHVSANTLDARRLWIHGATPFEQGIVSEINSGL